MIKIDESLLRVATATISYYKQLDAKELTQKDFTLWIDSLEEPMKGAFNKKGLDECRGVLNFQRFILELRDIGLDEYLKERLSPEDYLEYVKGI